MTDPVRDPSTGQFTSPTASERSGLKLDDIIGKPPAPASIVMPDDRYPPGGAPPPPKPEGGQ